jgi:hypothetical protein
LFCAAQACRGSSASMGAAGAAGAAATCGSSAARTCQLQGNGMWGGMFGTWAAYRSAGQLRLRCKLVGVVGWIGVRVGCEAVRCRSPVFRNHVPGRWWAAYKRTGERLATMHLTMCSCVSIHKVEKPQAESD